ncbi:vomeronasal type-1 receptor 2-like [Gracilinanus agilis]|uniref:vomeronasal type-1 receptor 2-like n=1 Tax=Gracilinanus agilis TaxID=191870 RepID=UPI001CFDB70E|nr:vomeronasal type-1 receptor 2-like [Gracilinanus agilis]
MVPGELICGVVFFFQCAIGIVGNSSLLMLYVYITFKKPQEKKSMDFIIAHLSLANIITICTRGIPEIIFCFGIRNVFDSWGAKIVMYIYRVSRGLSVCTTSLLSIFQAIIISPYNSVWARIKVRAFRYILHYFFFFWVTNALIYIPVIQSTEAVTNDNISSYRYISHLFVVKSRNNQKGAVEFMFSIFLHDIIFHFLMGLSSIHMVFLLYRHSKQVQYIYRNHHSPRSLPEVNATQTILLLVSCFVLFYCLNNCINLYLSFTIVKDVDLDTIAAFFSGCYPALCPLILFAKENRFPKFYCMPGKARRPHKDFMDGLVKP